MGTHRSLQSADVAAEKEKRGGGANGTGEFPNWEKWEKVERKRRKEKWRGRWGVLAFGGADGGEGKARASSAEPIYRPARLVLVAIYFLRPLLSTTRARG